MRRQRADLHLLLVVVVEALRQVHRLLLHGHVAARKHQLPVIVFHGRDVGDDRLHEGFIVGVLIDASDADIPFID